MTTNTDSEFEPDRHQQLLTQAITVLTEAARHTRPVLRPDEEASAAAGHLVMAESGRREPIDWAEFVTQALAGAAANLGSIDQALAGRSGSWEAAGLRDLLIATVGSDEQYLIEHRTEPVRVHLSVDRYLQESSHDFQSPYWRELDELDDRTDWSSEGAEDAYGAELDAIRRRWVAAYALYAEAFTAAVNGAAGNLTGLRAPVLVTTVTDPELLDQGPEHPIDEWDGDALAARLWHAAERATRSLNLDAGKQIPTKEQP